MTGWVAPARQQCLTLHLVSVTNIEYVNKSKENDRRLIEIP